MDEETQKLQGLEKELSNLEQKPTVPASVPAAPVAPVPTPEVPPAPPDLNKNKSRKVLWLAIGFFVLSLIIAGAYFLGQRGLFGQKPTATPTPISSPTPVFTTTPDPTANWETYSNSEYSFKHPVGLKSDTGAAGSAFESIRFQFMGAKQIASGRTETELTDGYAFTVVKIAPTDTTSPKQEAEKAYSNSKENCLSDDAIVEQVIKTTIGKNEAYGYSTKNCFGNYTENFVSGGKFVYSINQLYVGWGTEDYSDYKLITDQILSTFQFTE